jgi:hypothetical protein
MLTLPPEIMVLMQHFTPVFSERTWDWVPVLVVGAILAPGKRTVTAVLRVLGLSEDRQYQRYHRVLNRAVWSGLQVSQILLGLLVIAFVPPGWPVIVAADETLERRQGDKIKAKSVFRDAARSSKKHKVTSYGLRWVSMALLVSVPWCQRVWALPFLTVLAPSKKTNHANGKRHKTSIDWIMQMIGQVRRWLPERQIVLVVDGGLAAIKLGQRCVGYANPVTYVSRLRLDAGLYDWPGAQPKGKRGRKPKKGSRQPSLKARVQAPTTAWRTITIDWYRSERRTLDIATGTALWYTPGQDPLPLRWVLVRDPLGKLLPAAFFATDLTTTPEQILAWVVMRWGIEVTFEEARAHLGMETQRQWSDLAIARTTPALLGLFSFITLLAYQLTTEVPLPVRSTAWYTKSEATFSDVIAFVRRYLWTHTEFVQSQGQTGPVPISADVLHGLVDVLCYAA